MPWVWEHVYRRISDFLYKAGWGWISSSSFGFVSQKYTDRMHLEPLLGAGL